MLEHLMTAIHRMSYGIPAEDEGQTAVEYALVLVLIALALVTLVATGLGGGIASAINKITASLT